MQVKHLILRFIFFTLIMLSNQGCFTNTTTIFDVISFWESSRSSALYPSSKTSDYVVDIWLNENTPPPIGYTGVVGIKTNSGEVKEISVFRNGVKNGVCLTWLPSGHMSSNIEYKNGLMDGFFVTYYKNGRIEFIKHYTGGTLNGKEFYFSPTGEKIAEGINSNGKRQDGTFVDCFNCTVKLTEIKHGEIVKSRFISLENNESEKEKKW